MLATGEHQDGGREGAKEHESLPTCAAQTELTGALTDAANQPHQIQTSAGGSKDPPQSPWKLSNTIGCLLTHSAPALGYRSVHALDVDNLVVLSAF